MRGSAERARGPLKLEAHCLIMPKFKRLPQDQPPNEWSRQAVQCLKLGLTRAQMSFSDFPPWQDRSESLVKFPV